MEKISSMEMKILNLMQEKHKKKLSIKECVEGLNTNEYLIVSGLKFPKSIKRNYIKNEVSGQIETFFEKVA